MKNKAYFKRIIAFTLILTTLSTLPVYGADSKDKNKSKKITIEYEEIEEYVKKENLQIKLNKISLEDMEDALDSADDASGGLRDLQRNIYGIISMLDSIIKSEDPDLSTLASATQLSLELSSSSLDAQMPSSSGSNNQVKVAELGFEMAETNLVNSTQKMFVMYHQLCDNIYQLEKSRDLLVSQLEIAKHSLNYGLIAPTTIADLKSSILEFDTNYSSLVHQRETLILQFKGLLGLSHEDEVEFGIVPTENREYISNINFDKDLKKALNNSMSIKTKKAELSDADSKTKKYELQLKDNEVTLTLTNQYQLLVEKLDTLRLSENKLTSLSGKLIKEELRYNTGLISLMDLNSVRNEVESQKNTVKSNASNLFMEIENYEAMLNGMI